VHFAQRHEKNALTAKTNDFGKNLFPIGRFDFADVADRHHGTVRFNDETDDLRHASAFFDDVRFANAMKIAGQPIDLDRWARERGAF
jgi:hypothetical protein